MMLKKRMMQRLTLTCLACAGLLCGLPLARAEFPVNIGSRLELLVDHHLVESMNGVQLRAHPPRQVGGTTVFSGAYMTVLFDGERYLGYYRAVVPGYEGSRHDGHPGERTCVVKSRDGNEWTVPDLGTEADLGYPNVLRAVRPQRTHNFSPFLDTRPGTPEDERYKAIAGIRSGGLFAFVSADGIDWRKMSETKVFLDGNLDSQNVVFWSEACQRYELYFRKHNHPRTIQRAVSKDFLSWTVDPIDEPNLDGREHLYTNQTHPYFRASHIYIALPTRYTHGLIGGQRVAGNIGSTDIMLMTKRAGASSFDRTFKEAFIRPGLEPDRWGSRNNFVALNVVPTGPGEMSIYHRDGSRYVLRTDGFASAYGSHEGGELVTRPVIFAGNELVLNLSTATRGGVRVEIQLPDGEPVAGFALHECPAILGDSLEHVVQWEEGSDVGGLAGQPVRIRFELRDSDLYAWQFR